MWKLFVAILLTWLRLMNANTNTVVSIHVEEELPISSMLVSLSDLFLTTFVKDFSHMEVPTSFSLIESSSVYRVEQRQDQFFLLLKGRLDREGLCESEGTCCPSQTPLVLDKCMQSLVFLVQTKSGKNIYFNLNIFITDINDNAPFWPTITRGASGNPQYSDIFYEIKIPEDAEIGYKVDLPSALDLDAPIQNITQNYRFNLDGNYEDTFIMHSARDPETQELKPSLELNKRLDLNEQASFTGRLIAEDDGVPKKISELLVKIQIIDINNNSPFFNQSVYEMKLPENQKPGRIYRVQANDLDANDRDLLRYSFSKDGAVNYRDFQIEPNTGFIILKGQLDFEREEQIKLPIFVTDGKFFGETALVINLVNINDNYPVISLKSYLTNSTEEVQASGSSAILPSLTIYVRENCKPNEYIATLTYFDKDEQGVSDAIPVCSIDLDILKLEAIETPLKKKIFSISLSGTSLDREKMSHYRARIQCTDALSIGNKLTSYLELYIIILDLNDNEPKIPDDFHITVKENSPENTLITKIRIEDADEASSNTFTYELGRAYDFVFVQENSVNIVKDDSLFSLDRIQGKLFTKYSFDRELLESFSQDFIISDGVHNVTKGVKVFIQDENDCTPQFKETPIAITIPEDVKPPKLLRKIDVFDRDTEKINRQISFELESMTPNDPLANWLKIYENGEIWLKNPIKYQRNLNYNQLPIDREKDPVHFFTVTIKDRGNPQLMNKTTMEITIDDVNDNKPEWKEPPRAHQIINITRDLGIGSKIFKLLAIDNDTGLNGQVNYRIISGNDGEYFSLNETTGFLTLEKEIPTLSRNRFFIYDGQFKLYIQAVDSGEPQQVSNTIQLDIRAIKESHSTGLSTTNSEQSLNDRLDPDSGSQTNVILDNGKYNYSDLLMLIGLIIVTFIALVLILVMLTIFRCHQQKQIRQNHFTSTQVNTNQLIANEINRASVIGSGRWNYDTLKVVPFGNNSMRSEKVLEQAQNKNLSMFFQQNEIANDIQNRDFNVYLLGDKQSLTIKDKNSRRLIQEDPGGDVNPPSQQTIQYRNTFDESQIFRSSRRDIVSRGDDYTPLNLLTNQSDTSDDVEMKNSLMKDAHLNNLNSLETNDLITKTHQHTGSFV